MDTNQDSLTALLHFDGSNGGTTIADGSKIALGAVCVGTAALSTTQFKYGTASLKTGSANGNYLKLSGGQAYNFGSGDFTVEAWVWPVSQGSDYGAIFGRWDDTVSANKDWLVWRAADGSVNVSVNGSQVVTGAAGDLPTGAFAHVALTRSGTTLQVWVGGVAKGSGTLSGAINCARAQFAALGQSNFGGGSTYLEAYYDDFRVSVGLARYTGAFTPSTAAFEDYWNIVLLCHFDRAYTTLYWRDSSRYARQLTGSSGTPPAQSSAQSKFGGNSVFFSGAAAYITAPDAPELALGANDFCIEGWFYPTSVAGGTALLIEKYNGGAGVPFRILRVANQLQAQLSTNGSSYTQNIGPVGTLTTNMWYHVALVRQGTTITLYLNGVSLGTASIGAGVALWPTTFPLYFGGEPSAWYYAGYLDEWRIVTGSSVYTGAFTPPPAAFSDPGLTDGGACVLRGVRLRGALGRLVPVANRQAPTIPYGYGKLRDVTWGGTASVSGQVTVNNIAAQRRVHLVDLKSLTVIRAAWSDASGNYSFPNIDGSRKYLVLGRDYTQTYNAVVQDNITPVETAIPPYRAARRKLRFVAGGTGLGASYPALIRVAEGGLGTLSALALTAADLTAPVRYMPRARDDVADIIFTDTAGNQLDFWQESTTGTAPDRVAYYWVKLPGDLDAGPVDIYVRYNTGETLTKTSNGAALFPTLFDDFATYDTGKWAASGGSTPGASGSLLSVSANGSLGHVMSVGTYAAGLEVIANQAVIPTNTFTGFSSGKFGFCDGTTNVANAIAMFDNPGDFQAGSRLAINQEVTSSANGRFTPRLTSGRLALGRATDGSVSLSVNGAQVMTRTGASTANAKVIIASTYTSGVSQQLDWVLARKYIPSGPPVMVQFPEEFL
ncbi:DUF2341 domain-containing protein [Cupriavidus sp. IK-TO18]|uniref:DUF2341 domain-containing protein n=1 Tax=Cupriavidus sp. IK-TO18 TaxID=2782182 RepID=UPI00189C2632|nr:DUF2341 domain-containing protein [Cupriavidus sp. IK-TO18]MBF6987261.1 DUF2341 domain-containing protein [Cupriavidus sp. IK-TO18]